MQKQLLSLVIILANVLLAYIVISDPLRIINADGVLYLESAEAYLHGGWHAAMQSYPWPFYSVLIAWVSQFCHCSLQSAAYFLNIIFQTLICLGFFNLACEIKGSNQSLFMLLTVLVILFYPAFNHHRDLIIRDFGYWAFSLWGWFYLIRLNEKRSLFAGIQFNLSMLLASLFRLEGIVMLFLGPMALFFNQKKVVRERMSAFLKAYLITFMLLLGGLIYCWMYPHTFDSLGRLIELKSQALFGIQAIIDGLSRTKSNILHNVLAPVSENSAFSILFGGLIAVYIKNLIMTLTPFYSLLVVIFLWKKSFSPTENAKPIIYTAILINIFITVIFLMQSLFLNERYLFELAFLLLLWVPSGLLWLQQKTQREKKWLFPSVLVFLIGIGVISLHHFGHSKIYIKDAGNWLHENLPEKTFIYTNSPQLKFYINRPFITWQSGISDKNVQNIVQNVKIQHYSYLVFQINSSDIELKSQLNQLLPKPIKVFKNEKGDAVFVFALN